MRVEPFDTYRHVVFSRRAALLSGGVGLLFCGLGYRLYQLQVVEHEKYRADAINNQFNQRVVVPLRGEIYDRFGVPLATNRQNFRVLLIAEKTDDVTASLARLSEAVDLSERDLNRVMRELRRKRAFTPIEVVDNLSWEEFSRVNFLGPEFPGLLAEVAETRDYPFGPAVAPVVGYVGAASEGDLRDADDNEERLLRQPGFRIGKAGLERRYEDVLRGKAGSITVQVNAHGRVIDEYANEGDEPRQGRPLGLTIDADLQTKAMEILARPVKEPAEGEDPELVAGSAIVMDVVTGDILVMASTPAVDPNAFNTGISAAKWRELNESPYKPLINKSVTGLYPPGSTFKLLTALAAMEAGVSPRHRVHCNGTLWYGNRNFTCWKKGGHGTLDMAGSIKHSCDVYFWDLAQRVDIDDLAEVATRFGLGQTFDLGIGGQEKGVVPSRQWKEEFFRSNPAQQPWFPGETLSVAIGQGYVTSTTLQQAVMTARLATGMAVEPRLIRMRDETIFPPPRFAPLAVDREHLAVVQKGMDQVVNEWGTAARSRLEDPAWRMVGKTGTSQVMSLQRDPVTGERIRNEDLPRHQRDHALFVCYAPYENPRYACAVVIEHGSSGSKAAAPKARDIMTAVTQKDPLSRRAFDPSRDQPARLADLPWYEGGRG